MAKKLFVTGASGFLGWHVFRDAPADWQLIGCWHGNAAGLFPKAEAFQLDLTDREAVAALSREITHVVGVEIGAPPREVVLVAPGTIPKTSSGKITKTGLA